MKQRLNSLEKTKNVMKVIFMVTFIFFALVTFSAYVSREPNQSILGESSSVNSNQFILRRYLNGPFEKPLVIEDLFLTSMEFEKYPSVYTDQDVLAIFTNQGLINKDFDTYILEGDLYLETNNPLIVRFRDENVFVKSESILVYKDSELFVIDGEVLLGDNSVIKPGSKAIYKVDRFYKSEETFQNEDTKLQSIKKLINNLDIEVTGLN